MHKHGLKIIKILIEKLNEVGPYMSMQREDDQDIVLVCNNSCWAIGEIARRIPD
jgi:hypothetical protein